jgi:hypothetical protein
VFDPQTQLPRCDPSERIGGACTQFLITGNVVAERRTSEEQRATGSKNLRVDRRDWPARLSEECQESARSRGVHHTRITRLERIGVAGTTAFSA